VKGPRFGVRVAGSPGARSADFVAIEGIPVHSTVARLSRDGAEEGPRPERRGRERLQGSCSLRSGDPGARCTTRRPRALALPLHGAPVLPRGLRPPAGRFRPPWWARGDPSGLAKTRIERSPGRTRASLEKSAEVGKRSRGPRSANPPGNGRVHGDPAPERLERAAPGCKGVATLESEAAAPPRVEKKVRAGRVRKGVAGRGLLLDGRRLGSPSRRDRSRDHDGDELGPARRCVVRASGSRCTGEGATGTPEARPHAPARAVHRSGSAVRETAGSPAHPRRVMSEVRVLAV